MKNLIIGASSRFGVKLKTVLPGIYLSRQDLDIGKTSYQNINNKFDNVIVLINNQSKDIVEAASFIKSLFEVLDSLDFDRAYLFTSGRGTYIQSKDNEDLSYSVEKMLLNFVSYKKNFSDFKYSLIHPGHMELEQHYENAVGLFVKSFIKIPRKNLIWNLQKQMFMPF